MYNLFVLVAFLQIQYMGYIKHYNTQYMVYYAVNV